MKYFLYKILKFLFIPIIILLVFDFWLRNMNTIYKEKYNGILNVSDSVEVLILGNSHANYGVDPKGFTDYTYNLANVNQSLYFDKRITLSLLDELPRLKFVLISIDYHSLYFSDQGLRNIWSYYGNGVKYKDSDYLLADISPFLFGYTPKFAVSMLKKKIINNFKFKGAQVLDFDVEDGVDITKPLVQGFIAFDGVNESTFNIKLYSARVRAFNNVINNSNEHDEILVDLEDFIKRLKSRNITPVLFTTPTYREYNKLLDNKIIEKNREDVTHLCQKYGLIYIDEMNSPIFPKKYFNSCDHLNAKGAFKFGKIIEEKIKNRLWYYW